MTTTEPEPVTNQEIPVIADRVARGLITYLLTEGRDFLGDAIDEAIGDDQDADRFDPYVRSKVYSSVWDQLGRAVAEYQPRDQVLTEAHDLVQDVLPCPAGCDCAGQRAATALLAARTGLEG